MFPCVTRVNKLRRNSVKNKYCKITINAKVNTHVFFKYKYCRLMVNKRKNT